jgi:drug/metabolite transporter (DMT)-like permease
MQEFLFAFLALFAFSSKNILNKLLLKKLDVYSYLVIGYSCAIPFLVIALFSLSQLVPPSAETWLLILFSSAIGSASIIFFSKAVQSSKVSLVFAIAGSYPLFSILFSVFLLNEPFLPKYAVVLPAILAALFLLGYSKKEKRLFDQATWLALLTCIGWGAYFTLAKVVSSSINPFNATFFMESGVLAGVLAYALFSRKKLVLPSSNAQWLLIVPFSILLAIGSISANISLLTIGVSVTALVTSSAPGLTALFSRVFLKEKLSVSQYSGILLLVIALAILSL